MHHPDPFDHDVFVGYPGKDRSHAERVAAALRAVGLRVFIDVDLLPGSVFTSAIPDHLERARVFVWLVSPRSEEGWYDKDEGARAVELQRDHGQIRRLVPIRLGAETKKLYGIHNVVDIVVTDPPTDEELVHIAEVVPRVVEDARSHDPPRDASPAEAPARTPPPALRPPKQPYPVLAPYTHPALFAGRDADRDALVARLRDPDGQHVILLHAPSGAGKSSLLRAGLLPALRGQLDDHPPAPIALVDTPHDAGLITALLAQLVEPTPVVPDAQPGSIAEAFATVPDGPAICVLDQFEEIFEAPDPKARARVGLAIAATVLGTRRSARWVLAYRDDYHGRVCRWLSDILVDARTLEWHTTGLRFDLAKARATADVPLPLFGDPAGGEEPRAAARRAFAAAIEQPLQMPGAPWSWRIEPETRDALADAFAAARVEDSTRRARPGGDPDAAPLVPELQVVLARLMAEAGDDHVLRLEGDDPRDAADALIGNALRDHLCAALDGAVKTWRRQDAGPAQQRILLALQRLTSGRRRGPVVPRETLAALIGANADSILDWLAHPDRRLLIDEAADELDDRETRYQRLSHDRLAEAVRDESTARLARAADDDPLKLEDFVATASASFDRGNPDMAELSGRRRRALERLPAAVREGNEARRTWWAAVQDHGRRQRRNRFVAGIFAAVALVGLAGFVVHTLREGEIDAQIESSDPATNWRGLARRVADGMSPADAVAGLPDDMDWNHRRGLLAEVFVDDIAPAVECPIRRTVIEHRAKVAGSSDEFGALLAAADRLELLAAGEPACSGPAAGARAFVAARLNKVYGEPPARVTNHLDWQPIPEDGADETFGCIIGSPQDEPGRDSDEARRTVTLTRFEAMATEVTNDMFIAFWASAGRGWSPARVPGVPESQLGEYPANVNWYRATAFAAWVGGRLPTEAEWECMARAGEQTAYWSGGDVSGLSAVGWYLANSDGRAHAVGGLPANEWGLFDVHGNVWEWTADWYASARPAEGARDPRGPAGGVRRVLRGGSFFNPARFARAADRNSDRPGTRSTIIGFRVVRPTPAR